MIQSVIYIPTPRPCAMNRLQLTFTEFNNFRFLCFARLKTNMSSTVLTSDALKLAMCDLLLHVQQPLDLMT